MVATSFSQWRMRFCNCFTSRPGLYIYSTSGAGTGVPFHFHGPGFAEVIYGSKVIYLIHWFSFKKNYTIIILDIFFR